MLYLRYNFDMIKQTFEILPHSSSSASGVGNLIEQEV